MRDQNGGLVQLQALANVLRLGIRICSISRPARRPMAGAVYRKNPAEFRSWPDDSGGPIAVRGQRPMDQDDRRARAAGHRVDRKGVSLVCHSRQMP